MTAEVGDARGRDGASIGLAAACALLLLVAAQAADYLTFLAMVAVQGLAAERNPIRRSYRELRARRADDGQVGVHRARRQRLRHQQDAPSVGRSGDPRHGHPRGSHRRPLQPGRDFHESDNGNGVRLRRTAKTSKPSTGRWNRALGVRQATSGLSTHDHRYVPGPTRYSGRVSGPQDAVPTPRCAASRWTSSRLRRPVRRMVGGCEVMVAMARDRDLHRRPELDAQTLARPVAQLDPAHVGRPPASWGQMYGTNSSSTSACHRPTIPPRSGRGTSRVGQAEPLHGSTPGPTSSTVPTRGRSPSSGGMTASSSTVTAAFRPAVPLRWATRLATRRRRSGPRRPGRPRARVRRAGGGAVEPELRPGAGRGPRSGRYRSGRARGQLGRAREPRMDEPALGRHDRLGRRSGVGLRIGSGPGRPEPDLVDRDSEAGRRPGRVVARDVRDGQPALLRRRPARASAIGAMSTDRPDRPAGARERQLAYATTTCPRRTSHSARSQSGRGSACRLRSRAGRGRRLGAAPDGPARARCWCSQSAGLGVRSGKTRPSAQKSPSLGSSPKSPP